jgi:GT2 family glycosyltransferase
MANLDNLSLSTTHTLGEGRQEQDFLRSRPWLLDAKPQDPDNLIRTLRHEASRFHELPHQPTFSLLVVLRDPRPEHLHELILSCRCQSYKKWQLVLIDDASQSDAHLEIARRWASTDCRILIERLSTAAGPSRAKNRAAQMAVGDFLVVIDEDGLLHPMALGIFARHLSSSPGANLIFSNEAEIDPRSKALTNLLQKPPLDLFTLLRINYVGRLFAVGRALLEQAAGVGSVFRHEFDGIEEHDLLIRLALCGSIVSQHVPLHTYYRRAGSSWHFHLTQDELIEKRRRLLAEHVPRVYPGVTWTASISGDRDLLAASSLWITEVPREKIPRLLIVIPFKDQVATTIACLESIERQEHYLDVRVALVNNRSIEAETLPRLEAWISEPRTATYSVLHHDGAFNFARINNTAVRQFGRDCDLILLLNNDVELSVPKCLQVMGMTLLANPGAGFVGIKLNYPQANLVQHGGVRFAEEIHGSGCSLFCHAQFPSEFVDAERISLGVTFACAMTRRDTFEQLGGLEEVLLPNSFGDVDICLRALEAGFRNYYLGSLSGIHHESISRGLVDEEFEYIVLNGRQGQTIAAWRQRDLHRSGPWTSRLPLRYRLADRAIGTVKAGLGRHYAAVRSGVVRAGQMARRVKSSNSLHATLRSMADRLPFLRQSDPWTVRALRKLAQGGATVRKVTRRLVRVPFTLRRLASAHRRGHDAAPGRSLLEARPSDAQRAGPHSTTDLPRRRGAIHDHQTRV